MKYSKPEIDIKDILLPQIASDKEEWLNGTDFEGSEDFITDLFVNLSW